VGVCQKDKSLKARDIRSKENQSVIVDQSVLELMFRRGMTSVLDKHTPDLRVLRENKR